MMVILAQLGHTVLAASLTISMVRIIGLLIFISPLFAIGAIVGRQVGEQKLNHLPALLNQAWLLSLLLGIPMLLLFYFIGPLLTWAHQPADVIPYISIFFKISCFAIFPIMMSIVVQQFLSGAKHQHWMMCVSIFGLCCNTFFTYSLGLGHFGFPKLGVEGVAIGNVITSWLAFIILMILAFCALNKMKCPYTLKVKDFIWGKMILKIGTPICIQISSEMLMLFAFTIMTGWFGKTAMAGSQISNEYMLFVIVPIFGLSEASGICVGHARGAKHIEKIHKIGHAGILLAVMTTLLCGLIFAIFHRPLANLFIHFGEQDAQAIYQLAMILLAIRVASELFYGVYDMINGSLRGLYDTKFPMRFGIFMNWFMSIPIAYLLAVKGHMGVIGLCIATLFTGIIAASVMLLRWRWQNKQLMAEMVTQ